VGGLRLELAFPPDGEERADRLLERLRTAGDLLQEWFGPLPWKRVAAALVAPREGIEGVSLPGLLLASPEDAAATLEDELSHQWHFHAAGLPNELSEGLSVFTGLLLEESRDPAAARRSRRARVRHLLSATRAAGDAAVADPRIYTLASYSAIAFQKPAAALFELRGIVGGTALQKGLRRAVAPGDGDPWTRFRRGLQAGTERDLEDWFRDRFFRPGVPVLEVRGTPVEGGREFRIAQVREGPPRPAVVEVEAELENGGRVRRFVTTSAREETRTIPLPSPPRTFRIDPDATGLFRRLAGRGR